VPKVYRIHPAIGIARLGDSQDFFIGPEAPGLISFKPPGGNYRDATTHHNILRQGARFRIYESTYPDGGPQTQPTAVREITDAEAVITWKVRLVNAKADNPGLNSGTAPDGVTTITNRPTQLHIDTDEQPIQGKNKPLQILAGDIFKNTAGQTTVKLGDIKTDQAGQLIVLGGHGKSACPFVPATPVGSLHNSWWYDDASDGTVNANIQLRADGSTPPVEAARILVGPPDFAPAINNIVSMYDLLYDLATQLPPNVRLTPPATVSFTRDIFPVLLRASQMYWVENRAHARHAPGTKGGFMDPALFDLLKDNNATVGSPARKQREAVFGKLRNPAGGGTATMDMPKLNGGLTLTPTQYAHFRLWSAGTFDADWNPAWQGFPPEIPFQNIADADRPGALDKAALETAVGGSFDPGIEGCLLPTSRKQLGHKNLRVPRSRQGLCWPVLRRQVFAGFLQKANLCAKEVGNRQASKAAE
jgi:hypothetical protein